MIPRVTEARQVQNALECMKYPPIGKRGSVLGRGHTDFKSGAVAEAMAIANEESMLVVQIETREALDNLGFILDIPGVDVALIGPNDLSIALGVPGEMNHPSMISGIEKMIAACKIADVTPAIHFNDLQLAVGWAAKGMRMVSISSEVGFLMQSARDAVSTLRSHK